MKKAIGLLMVLALCIFALPLFAADVPVTEVSVPNLMMEQFTNVDSSNAVATGWTTFVQNDDQGHIKFFQDIGDKMGSTDASKWVHQTYPENWYDGAPYSTGAQGIAVGKYYKYIDGRTGAAGMYRTVDVTPGKIYLYHGWMDFWPTGRGINYRPLFGINPTASVDPAFPCNIWDYVTYPVPNVGNARWGGLEAGTFDYDTGVSASPEDISSFYRMAAAWPAESSTISLWHGVAIRTGGGSNGSAGADDTYTPGTPPVYKGDHYELDSFALHEFSFKDPMPVAALGVANAVSNGDFQHPDAQFVRDSGGVDPVKGTTYPNWRIPVDWVPIGGGFGMYYEWNIDAAAGVGGTTAARMLSRRGANYYGIMQKVKIQLDPSDPEPSHYKWSCNVQGRLTTRTDPAKSGARVELAVDPTGGVVPGAAHVLHVESQTNTGLVPLQIPEQVVTSNGQEVTIFLMLRNVNRTTGQMQGTENNSYAEAIFDDVVFRISKCDNAPPAAFTVTTPATINESNKIHVSTSTDPKTDACLASQWYRIGTTAGGYEVTGANWIPLPLEKDIDLFDVKLPKGNIYVTVRRIAKLGQYTDATSNATNVDILTNTYNWGAGEHVSYNMFSSDSPSIACAADGVYLAYRDTDGTSGRGTIDPPAPPWWEIAKWAGWNSKIAFRKRVGSSWTAPQVLATNPNAGGEGQGAWDPYLFVDATGKVQCLWQGGGTYYFNELWKRSTSDGGNTWDQSYFGFGSVGVNWFNKGVSDSMGNIIVACNTVTPMDAQNPGEPGNDRNYQPSILTFDGTNWTPEQIAIAGVSEERGNPTPTIAADSSGKIYAIWHEKFADGWHLRFDRRDGPGQWTPGADVAWGLPQSLSGNGDYSIAVAPDGSKVHVVYVNNFMTNVFDANGQIVNSVPTPGVYYVSSTDGGATWSSPLFVTNGAWPQIKLSGSRLHLVSYTMVSPATNKFVWRPRHTFIENGKISSSVDIGAPGYTSQPSYYDLSLEGTPKVSRTDYTWGKMLFSHLAPGSFDIDAQGKLHLAWSNNSALASKSYWWVDYYNTAGDVPASDNLAILKAWAMDGTLWGGGYANKAINLDDMIVTAKGNIVFGDWFIPYVYIQNDDRSAGIRVFARQNIDTANSTPGDPNDDINVGDTVRILAAGKDDAGNPNADYNSAVTVDLAGATIDWMLYGEPNIGRVAGKYTIKGVTMEKVVPGTKTLPAPMYMSNKTVGGVPGPYLPQVENFVGTQNIGLFGSVYGKVTFSSGTALGTYYFYVDDGSGTLGEYVYGYGRIAGVKVYSALYMPMPNSFYAVRGALSTERALISDPDGTYGTGDEVYGQIRVIRPAIDDPYNPGSSNYCWEVYNW